MSNPISVPVVLIPLCTVKEKGTGGPLKIITIPLLQMLQSIHRYCTNCYILFYHYGASLDVPLHGSTFGLKRLLYLDLRHPPD